MEGAEFEWDEGMAALNAAKHGVAFRFALAVFLDAGRADFDVSRPEDGETRRKVGASSPAGCSP